MTRNRLMGMALGALSVALGAAALGSGVAQAQQSAPAAPAPFQNDYPTVARADYVFACMAANGQSRDVLERCSCSIDVIASILPYERYVDAETVLSMRLISGENASLFRTAAPMRSMVADLRRAQAEAEIRCF